MSMSEHDMVQSLEATGKYNITPKKPNPKLEMGTHIKDSPRSLIGNLLKASCPSGTSTPRSGAIHKGSTYTSNVNLQSDSAHKPNEMNEYVIEGQNDSHIFSKMPSVPKIPQFSGDDPPQKGDVTYAEWRFEIKCLEGDPDISSNLLLQSIRRSLRGTARKMLISLGEKASLVDILTKLDSLFGEVSTNGMILQEFFNAYQMPNEGVTAFGCRLESMIQSAVECGYLDRDCKNGYLKEKFWTCLRSDGLKAQTRHKFETIERYEDLLKEVRKVERELNISNYPPQVKIPINATTHPTKKSPHQAAINFDKFNELELKFEKKLEQLEKRLDDKIDQKFDLILQKLDQRNPPINNQQPNFNNNSRGGGCRGRFSGSTSSGRGRGNTSNSNHPN